MKITGIVPSSILLGAACVLLPGVPFAAGQTAANPKAAALTVKNPGLPRDTGSGTSSTVATDPVGFTSTSLLPSSDSLVSIPLTRSAAFAGAIGAVSGNIVTVASSPNWTSNQYVYNQGVQSNTYYAIIGPLLATVTGTVTVANGSTAVVATAGLSNVAPGDELVVNGLAYNVASVTSDTALVLSRPYNGTGGSGLTASYDHSPKEGSYYTVTANSANSLTVNLNGDSISAVAPGTTVTLIPYWTLGTAFPASDAGTSYVTSSSPATRDYQTQIYLPDMTDPGINLSSPVSYFNFNGAWRLAGSDGTVAYNDTVLPPTSFFTIRTTAAATTFTPTGGVYMNRITAPLDTQSSTAQDNAVSVPRPVAVSLNDLGLITSGAFVASLSPATRSLQDTLLTYDNTATGINKSSPISYYYFNNAWRLTGSDGTADYGTTAIPYGTGFTIRKTPVSTGATSFWQNTRTY